MVKEMDIDEEAYKCLYRTIGKSEEDIGRFYGEMQKRYKNVANDVINAADYAFKLAVSNEESYVKSVHFYKNSKYDEEDLRQRPFGKTGNVLFTSFRNKCIEQGLRVYKDEEPHLKWEKIRKNYPAICNTLTNNASVLKSAKETAKKLANSYQKEFAEDSYEEHMGVYLDLM